MRRFRWACGALALTLAGCGGGQKHFPVQAMSPSDQGRFYIRSVTVVSNESEADFDNAFRRRLNEAANIDQPSGEPVDLYLTVEDFKDATLAEEIFSSGQGIGRNAVSNATAEIALRDPNNRNRPIYRDRRTVDQGSFGGVLAGHPLAFALSLAVTAAASAATNEAEAMGEDLAEVAIDDLVNKGFVMLPKDAAFALPPRARDDRRRRDDDAESRDARFESDGSGDDSFSVPPLNEGAPDDAPAFAAFGGDEDPTATAFAAFGDDEDSAGPSFTFGAASANDDFVLSAAPPEDDFALQDGGFGEREDPEPIQEAAAANDALSLGTYPSESAAQDEADRITRFSGDVAPAESLRIAPDGDGYALSAVGLRPSAARMLCARRRIEEKPCN